MKYLVILGLFSLSLFASSSLKSKDNYRYFGGISEVKVKTPTSIMLTPSTIVTEEVFSAKNNNEIDVAILKQKKEQVDNGERAKDFAMEKTGHLYGGLSEGNLSY
jgi:hypothetical protein